MSPWEPYCPGLRFAMTFLRSCTNSMPVESQSFRSDRWRGNVPLRNCGARSCDWLQSTHYPRRHHLSLRCHKMSHHVTEKSLLVGYLSNNFATLDFFKSVPDWCSQHLCGTGGHGANFGSNRLLCLVCQIHDTMQIAFWSAPFHLFFCDSAVVTPESDVVRSRPINYLLLLSTVLQKVDEPVKS